jgi:hypothetical protein
MLVAPQPYPRGTEKQTRSAPRTVFGILDYCDGVRADLLHAQIREWNPDATIILLDNASPYNAARSATHVNGVNTYVGGGIRDLICLAEEAGALYLLFCASDVEICDPLTIRNFENFMEAHPKAVQFSCSTTRDSHQAKYFPWMARRRGGSPRRVRHADLLCCMLRLDFVRSFGGFPLSRGGWGYDRELAYHAQRGRKAIYVNDRCTVRHIDSRPRIAAEAGELIDKGKEMETVYAARYGDLAVLSIPETRLDRVRRRWSRLRKKLKSRLRRLKTSSWSQSHSG